MRQLLAVLLLTLLTQAGTSPPRFEALQPDLLSTPGAFVNAAADYDGDGDVDLFVGFNGTPNRLYRNDRGTLVDDGARAGVADARATRAAAWGDFDGDGDSDLLVGFTPGDAPLLRLYRNHRGRFTDVTDAAGLAVREGAVRQPAWIDVDGDDDLDLFVAFRDRSNILFRNDGGRFTDIAAEIGVADSRKSVGAVWFDFDRDGDLDLYVGNMDGDSNGLYLNDRGRFADVAGLHGLQRGGRPLFWRGTVRPCVADVDGDGVLDLFTANYGPPGLFSLGGPWVRSIWAYNGLAIEGSHDTCAFADIDHDGRVDVYMNGTYTGNVQHRDYLLWNAGDGFLDVTPENVLALNADHGALWADFDGDGAQDLALTGVRPDGMHLVLRNALAPDVARRSLQVRITDPRGRATRAGAEVRIYTAGTMNLLGTRIVDSGSGYNAQSDIPVHFGLPSMEPVDVEVIWPAGGRRHVARALSVEPRRHARRPLVIKVGPAR